MHLLYSVFEPVSLGGGKIFKIVLPSYFRDENLHPGSICRFRAITVCSSTSNEMG